MGIAEDVGQPERGLDAGEHAARAPGADRLMIPANEASGKLVFDPVVRPSGPNRFQIRGRRSQSGVIAWGFWGGLLAVIVAVGLIVSAASIYTLWDIMGAVLVLVVGVVLYRFGPRSSMRDDVLCEVNLDRATLAWPGALGSGAELVLPFDDVTELVFGMTDFPVSPKRRDVSVHAFTLLVRDDAQRLIPIIEATPNKGEAHNIAKILADEIGQPIRYVGKGIQ